MKVDLITRIGVCEFGGNEGLRESNEGSSLWYHVISNEELPLLLLNRDLTPYLYKW